MVNLADRLLCVKLHERSFYLGAVKAFLSVNFRFSRSFFLGKLIRLNFISGITVLKIKAKAKSFELPQSPNKIYFL